MQAVKDPTVVTPDAVRAGGADASGDDHGRAVVRDVFFARLDEAGLVRGKKASIPDHAALRDRMADYLSYMSRANLIVLAEAILTVQARAKLIDWPSEAVIRGYAEAIQRRPFRENRIMQSWLGSVEGPVAEARGFLVELYRYLRRTALPPPRGSYGEGLMVQEAQDNKRRVVLIEEWIAADVARADDRAWLADYRRDEMDARALVDAGRARRSAVMAAADMDQQDGGDDGTA